jgi:hypothetical protein
VIAPDALQALMVGLMLGLVLALTIIVVGPLRSAQADIDRARAEEQAAFRRLMNALEEASSSCPRCGAEPGTNIDCPRCLAGTDGRSDA